MQRAETALDLRREGKTYRVIAKELGVSKATAHTYVDKLLNFAAQELVEDADELRQLELERLDYLQRRATDLAENAMTTVVVGTGPNAYTETVPDMVARNRALQTLLRISESRRKLEGIDAPERRVLEGNAENPIRIEHEVSALSDEELDSELAGVFSAADSAFMAGAAAQQKAEKEKKVSKPRKKKAPKVETKPAEQPEKAAEPARGQPARGLPPGV